MPKYLQFTVRKDSSGSCHCSTQKGFHSTHSTFSPLRSLGKMTNYRVSCFFKFSQISLHNKCSSVKQVILILFKIHRSNKSFSNIPILEISKIQSKPIEFCSCWYKLARLTKVAIIHGGMK